MNSAAGGLQDRVTEFFEIARAEVEDVERNCRLKDVDLEKEEDRHLLELKVTPSHSWSTSRNRRT